MTRSASPAQPLQGKVAIITGAGSGIGKAIALCLGQAGAKVVVAEINPDTGESAATEIRKKVGGQAIFIQTDVTQSNSIRAMVQATVDAFGRLDIAVNNAAVPPDSAPLCEMDEAYWQRVIATNLTGVALCLKWQLRQMGSQDGGGGTIINMASATVNRAQPNLSAYIAAKHGVVGLTRTAAHEAAAQGIRVNAVAPGGVATDFTLETMRTLGLDIESEMARTSLFKRFATLEEVAGTVMWLASNAASYVNGAVVPVDGGMSVL
ncbi:hypothetical protein BJX99DRAFT_271977 [Aspergillus californicus]